MFRVRFTTLITLIDSLIELVHLFYVDFEEQQWPKTILRFLVHSFTYPHYLTKLFGEEVLKDTYLHKLYLQDHLPSMFSSTDSIIHQLGQFRWMNFRDCSSDEQLFRLIRKIYTSYSSSSSELFVEVTTRKFYSDLSYQRNSFKNSETVRKLVHPASPVKSVEFRFIGHK